MSSSRSTPRDAPATNPIETDTVRAEEDFEGLYVTIGLFDWEVFATHLEAAFTAQASLEESVLGPLLDLAERVAEAAEALADDGAFLPPAVDTLASLCDEWLALAEEVEDAGVTLADASQSRWGERFLWLREHIAAGLVGSTPWLGVLLSGPPEVVDVHTLREAANLPVQRHRRSYLQFWLLSALQPEFRGFELPSSKRFLGELQRLVETDRLLGLLQGTWEDWPSFEPDRVLTLGGVPNRALELPVAFDWVLSPARTVAAVAERLDAVLRRALHLEFLREHAPEEHLDVVQACGDWFDDALTDRYEEISAARPWSEPYAAAWRYLTGETPHPPDPAVVPRLPMAEPDASEHARDVLTTYREVRQVWRKAAERGCGVFVLFHDVGEQPVPMPTELAVQPDSQ